MTVQSREHLTHILLRQQHGRYDVALVTLPLCEFDRNHRVGDPIRLEPGEAAWPLDLLAQKYFPQHFAPKE